MRSERVSFSDILPFAMLGAGAAIGVAVPRLIAVISGAGHNINSPDLSLDYLKGVFLAAVFGCSILLWPVGASIKRHLLWLWGARCVLTLGIMLYYEYAYGLDAYVYYDTAVSSHVPWHNPDYPVGYGKGTGNMRVLVWVLNRYVLPLNDSFHALKVTFAMIGFIGVFLLFRGAMIFLDRDLPPADRVEELARERTPDRWILYAFGLCPTILFWSSILGKDPVNMFGVALYFYGVIGWFKRRGGKYLLSIVAGVVIAGSLRSWSAMILLMPLPLVFGVWGIKSKVGKVFLSGIFLGVAYFAVKDFASSLTQISIDSVVESTNAISHSWARGGSGQVAPKFNSLWSMIKFAPLGMFTALFRPLPGEILNPFGMLAGVENAGLLWLLASSFRRGRMSEGLREPMVCWALLLVFVWSFLYGFISYQNLGAASRFKLQILPILLPVLLYLVYQDRLRGADLELEPEPEEGDLSSAEPRGR